MRGGLEPYRADVRAAQLAAIFANTHRKKGARPYTVDDFMPAMFDRRKSIERQAISREPAAGKIAHAGTEAFRQYLLAMGAKEVPKDRG